MNNSLQINQVLESMQSIRSKMPVFESQALSSPDVLNAPGSIKSGEFSGLLKSAIDTVNETQMNASQLSTAFQKGEAGVDITQVMVALEKSSVSFEAMKQVRNKMMDAYRDVMNMPV